MGAIDTIMKDSKLAVDLSEELVKSLDADTAKVLGDDLTKISEAIKELDRQLTDGSKDVNTECEIVKENIREIEDLNEEFKFLDELIALFDATVIIDELENAPRKAIMALKLGRSSSNFGVAGEILRGEV